MTEPSLPFNEDFAESCQSKGMSIGGASCSASDGTIEVFNPASGQVWAKAPDATRDDARAAACLPLGETVPSDPLKTSIVERHPLGVVTVSSRRNVPLLLSGRGKGAALAVGNAIVLDLSEETPVAGGLTIAEVFKVAGIPPGVLNLVTCSRENVAEAGDELVPNPKVRAISFTSSTAVGQSIAGGAGSLLNEACVELGGKDSLIVLNDADLDAAVKAARLGAFFHQGQICNSAERIIVDRKPEDGFMTRFVAATKKPKVGDSTRMANQIGPMINETQARRVDMRLAQARVDGVEFHAGGTREGLHCQPTFITGAAPDMEMYHAEAFGPVASVMSAVCEDEAIAHANSFKCGLSASVITQDEERGLAVARRIESGMAHVNDTTIHDEPTIPFGGRERQRTGAPRGALVGRDLYRNPMADRGTRRPENPVLGGLNGRLARQVAAARTDRELGHLAGCGPLGQVPNGLA